MKCLEVKVGVTEPSYHRAIRCNSDSQSCDALENRAHRLPSISVSPCCRQTGDTTGQSHKLMRLPVSDES